MICFLQTIKRSLARWRLSPLSYKKGVMIAQDLATIMFLLMVIAILSSMAWNNEKGLKNLLLMADDITHTSKELTHLYSENGRLENLITRMDERALDIDLLEERVRTVLGTAAPNDIVIIIKDE